MRKISDEQTIGGVFSINIFDHCIHTIKSSFNFCIPEYFGEILIVVNYDQVLEFKKRNLSNYVLIL